MTRTYEDTKGTLADLKWTETLPDTPPADEAGTLTEQVDREQDREPDELDDLTLAELRDIADAEDVDLAGATRKADVADRIRAHRGW